MPIKRYQLYTDGFDNYTMRERKDGEFVKVEDAVDAIRAYIDEHGQKTAWDREGALLDAIGWKLVDLLRGDESLFPTKTEDSADIAKLVDREGKVVGVLIDIGEG